MISSKQIKRVSLLVAMVFCLGLAGVAQAAPAPTVGIVDVNTLMSSLPEMQKASEILKAEFETNKKEYESKAPSLSEKDRAELDKQLSQKQSNKEQEILKPIYDNIAKTIKEVAAAKGLSVVVDRGGIITGDENAMDITQDVYKKMTSK